MRSGASVGVRWLLGVALLATGAPSAVEAAPPSVQPAAALPKDGVVPLQPVEATTAEGLVVSADVRDAYVSGFPILVHVTVRNPTDTPRTFPDLAKRPWLVRFRLELAPTAGAPPKKSERFSTPPATDPGGAWTLAPRGERRVLLEIPASANLAGTGTLAVTIGEGTGAVALPAHPVVLQPAAPVAGEPLADANLRSTAGVDVPWVQAVRGAWDLHVLHLSPRSPSTPDRLLPLARLREKPAVQLSRARPQDAGARWLYWPEAGGRFKVARLEATGLEEAPRTVAVPYADAVPLARGVTDGQGGLEVPLWVPAPAGAGRANGRVLLLCVDRRGAAVVRKVTELPARPGVVETGVDAAGNPLLLLGHAAGLDLYRVDPTLPAELPAKGVRLRKLDAGETVVVGGFDAVADTPERAGGLVVLAITTRTVEGKPLARERSFDLAGKALVTGEEVPWQVPGAVIHWLTRGEGPWSALSRDAKGAWWVTTEGRAPARVAARSGRVGERGVLWDDGDTLRVRTLGGPRVIEDAAVAPAR